MTRYTVDGVAMSRYLVDRLPSAADEVFSCAENGIDVLEAPAVAVSEVLWAVTQKGSIAGIDVDTTPNAVLRGLVPADEQDLAVSGSLIDRHTLHDALLIANHRVRGTEAIVTNDGALTTDPTVWE